jgi:PAS domain S-box-containing protein
LLITSPDGSRRPRSPGEIPAAVLVVDLDDACVTAANHAGRELAPDCPLPAAVDDWLAAARLGPPDAAAYDGRLDPVTRIVSGDQVSEAVRVRTAQQDLLFRITGVPVGREPDAARQALVVLDPLAGEDVTNRAVLAAGTSFTLTDPRLQDDPLIFVNPAFERTTGYTWEEVAGRNCRLLQGPETDLAEVAKIGKALRDGTHCKVTVLNYRKDGTTFWNELSVSPVFDGDGVLTQHVGIQSDVTDRVRAELETGQLLAAERTARAAAERAQRQLALLAEATTALAASLDVDDSIDQLSRLVVPLMADWCTVQLFTPDGRTQRVAARHRDTDHAPLMRRVERLLARGLSDESMTAGVLRGGTPVLVDVDDEALDRGIADPDLRALYRQIGLRHAIVVPLRARSSVLGALTLFTDGSGRTYDEDDLTIAADLARRAALAIDNTLLYQREHEVAEQLQRSLLPGLPQVTGLDPAARYLPSASGAQVGGDWYDVFPLPDGTVGLAIGDVMGHDMTAAAAMGQLRSVLRSYAWQGDSPAVVLDRLDQLVQGLDMAQLATCVYGRLQLPTADGPGHVQLCNAGHLPPVLRGPDGSVRLLGGAPSLLVGAALGTTRAEAEEPLLPGSMLVLCTDGLVEHRGRGIDEGLAALQAAVASAPDTTADEVCQHLLDELAQGRLEDDVALLVVRVV